jgi:hypothetical protein
MEENHAGTLPELSDSKSHSTNSIDKDLGTEKVLVVDDPSEEEEVVDVIEKAEDVAIQVALLSWPPGSIYSLTPDSFNVRRPKPAVHHLPLDPPGSRLECICVGEPLSACLMPVLTFGK